MMRFRRCLFFSLILVCIGWIGNTAIQAKGVRQVSPVSREAHHNSIYEIIVQGAHSNDTQKKISDELLLKKGDEFDLFKLRTTIRNIRSVGLFQEANYRVISNNIGKKIIIKVTENVRIDSILFDGVTVVSQNMLLAAIQSKKGDVVDMKLVRKDIERLNSFYEERGYGGGYGENSSLGSRVKRVTVPFMQGEPLIFHISEKKIESIRVTGNKVTNSSVLTREMTLKPGKLLHAPTLKEDFRRIYNLNYFTDLKPHFYSGEEEDGVVLQIDVLEKASQGSFTFGGSYGPTSGLGFFNNLYWDNVAGSGQLVMLNAQLNNISSTYQFKYYNPWMWDERKSLTFKIWYRDGSVESVNPLSGGGGLTFLAQKSTGTELGFGIPISYNLKTNHTVKHENVNITSSGQEYSIESYTFGLIWDTRDIIFNPTQGDYDSFSVERAFPLIPKAINFTKYDIDLKKYIKTMDQQTIALRLLVGFIESPLIDNQALFSREYYRVGGVKSVRGYNEFNPFAIGNQQVVISAEYRFLFTDVFQLILFADAGYAPEFLVDSSNTYNRHVNVFDFSQYRVGKGIGTRITVPVLGPIRLDFGIDDAGNSRIHFNVGYLF